MSKLPYGYKHIVDGNVAVNESEANIVREVFSSYLAGESLGRIADTLFEHQIASPTGKDRWTATAIDKMLLNAKYIPVVGLETYADAQFERDRRSKTDLDTGKRKTARYSSSSVLSGLLVCSECGNSYRCVQ